MTPESKKKIYTLIAFFLNAGMFTIGIVEAIIAGGAKEFHTGCQDIWYWIVVTCIIDISVPILTGCGIMSFSKKDNMSLKRASIIIRFGNLIMSIWTIIAYTNIAGTDCAIFWQSNASDVWTLLVIHFAFTCAGIGLFIVSAIIAMMVVCCNCNAFDICCDVDVPPTVPVANAPTVPVAKAPIVPVAKAPTVPVAKAPIVPVAKAPVDLQVQMPEPDNAQSGSPVPAFVHVPVSIVSSSHIDHSV